MSQAIAENFLSILKDRLGQAWDSASEADKALLESIAEDAAEQQVKALATNPAETAAIAQLARERKQLDAQFANLASIASTEASSVFWDIVAKVEQTVLKLALAAV